MSYFTEDANDEFDLDVEFSDEVGSGNEAGMVERTGGGSLDFTCVPTCGNNITCITCAYHGQATCDSCVHTCSDTCLNTCSWTCSGTGHPCAC